MEEHKEGQSQQGESEGERMCDRVVGKDGGRERDSEREWEGKARKKSGETETGEERQKNEHFRPRRFLAARLC